MKNLRMGLRPARWLRIASAGLMLVFLGDLIADHDQLTDFATAAILCALMAVSVVAPSWLYDGRATRWSRAHPALAVGAVGLMITLVGFAGLSSVFSVRASILGAAVAGLVVATLVAVQEHRQRRGDTRAK